MTSYRDLAARMTDGPDLPDGPLAVPASTPPGPYSEHAVAALVASRDARIRELEAELHRLRGVEAAAPDDSPPHCRLAAMSWHPHLWTSQYQLPISL